MQLAGMLLCKYFYDTKYLMHFQKLGQYLLLVFAFTALTMTLLIEHWERHPICKKTL